MLATHAFRSGAAVTPNEASTARDAPGQSGCSSASTRCSSLIQG